jgi:hypothetical protein
VIVGLVGKKSSGKDTAGAFLVDDHGFIRHSFADALKQSAAALFDVPVETWDELKNNEAAHVTLHGPGISNSGVVPWAALTVREFLQRYGTEAHRDVFGGDFWVKVARAAMLKTLMQGGDDPMHAPSIVVTDVRFPEEAQTIRDLGGMIVRVVRPEVEVGDTHASEVVQESIEANFELWNGGTIADLRSGVAFDIVGVGLGGGRTEMSRALAREFTDEGGST